MFFVDLLCLDEVFLRPKDEIFHCPFPGRAYHVEGGFQEDMIEGEQGGVDLEVVVCRAGQYEVDPRGLSLITGPEPCVPRAVGR